MLDLSAVPMVTMKIRLRELMQEKTVRDSRYEPVTQEEVADAIGVSRQTLSAWTRNTVDRLDKNMLAKLCQYFECEIGDLLRLEKDEAPPAPVS